MNWDSDATWIVIPTLNEAENITPLLTRIRSAMYGLSYHLCVVDDGSRDGTSDQVLAFKRSNNNTPIHLIQRRKSHFGSQRGVAVWTGLTYGFHHSNCSVFVEMDADLSHRPEEMRTGIDAIRISGYNVAIASKYQPTSQILNRAMSRRVLSKVANTVVRTLISREIGDYSNGYRFYDRECVKMICGHRLRYGSPIYLSEVLALLLAHRMRICEFPSIYVGRDEGLSKLRPIDLVKAGIAVIDIAARFHLHLRGFVRGEPVFSSGPVSEVEPQLMAGPEIK